MDANAASDDASVLGAGAPDAGTSHASSRGASACDAESWAYAAGARNDACSPMARPASDYGTQSRDAGGGADATAPDAIPDDANATVPGTLAGDTFTASGDDSDASVSESKSDAIKLWQEKATRYLR